MTRESLAVLDVEIILDEIDNENNINKNNNNNQFTHYDENKKSPSNLQIQISCVDTDTDTETKTESDEDENELSHFYSMHNSISVERFKEILESTDENYDVEEIVNELTPNSNHEFISFTDIASYHKPIKSISI